MRRPSLPTLALLAILAGIIGFAGVGVYTFRQDVKAMRVASQEGLSWTVNKLQLELDGFRESLMEFQIAGPEGDPDTVNTRFDILWSRIALFQQGKVGARLARYESGSHVVSRLFDVMKDVDRDVVNLKPGDTEKAAELLEKFAPFPAELADYSRAVTVGEELRGRQIRERLESSVNITLGLFALATVIALLAVAYFDRESKRFQKLAAANRALADAAEKASRAKSQFLTMMSHELRTPMNGVLGLLALSKQNETQSKRRNLIQQAEHSARQMVALLADILDFSALQADDIQLDKKPFEIGHLAKAVGDRFAPQARREGVSIEISVSESCPTTVRADFRRLRQAFGHLTQYIVETAGARHTSIDFDCHDGNLLMRLTFEYTSSGGAWRPDLILGEDERTGDKFATDALGPAIARGLIEKMGGKIRVDTPGDNRISVVAAIPVESFDVSTLNVDVMAATEAMGAICRAALKGDNIRFLQEGDDKQAHIVLIESGNGNESGFLKAAQTNYPDALLVALGRPINVEAFDFVIELPLDFQELRQIVYRQIA